jgi:hypothetical protein
MKLSREFRNYWRLEGRQGEITIQPPVGSDWIRLRSAASMIETIGSSSLAT